MTCDKDCEYCKGTGIEDCFELDNDTHQFILTGTRTCRNLEEEDEDETDYQN